MVNFIKDRKSKTLPFVFGPSIFYLFKKFVQQRWPTGHRINQIVQLLIVRSHAYFVDGKTSQRGWYSFPCIKKTQMVLNSSSAQMTRTEQPIAALDFVIQPVPGAFSLVLYPLYLQFLSPCLSPSSSPPWLPVHCTDIKLVCINLLTVSASREARAPETESKALIHIQGPGARHSLNLVKLWKNEACINWMRHSINFCKRLHH